MNIQVPQSPASIISNGWPDTQSKRAAYQRQYYHPASSGYTHNSRALDTPPLSASLTGEYPPFFSTSGSASPTMSGRGGDFRGNPSPPGSVTGGRSSNGSGFIGSDTSAAQRRKQSMMEETLGQHYYVLKRYLASTAQDEAQDAKPSRARDKLPRLSPTQFQELSTDVYDEFQRRQAVAARQGGAASPDAAPPPNYLLPVQGFYPERNQARQKLSTLPAPKFRHLARDVFFELGRRIPRFAAGDIPRQGSPGLRGSPSRTGTPSGMRPTSRTQNGRPGQTRQGSLASQVFAGGVIGGIAGADGPMQKSLQNNTIIPNKSYLVEDDDEDGDSVYGLNRRDTAATSRSYGAQPKIVADYQNKVDELQAKIDELQGKVGDLEDKVGDLNVQVEEKNTVVTTMAAAQDKHEQEASEAAQQFEELRSGLEAKLISAQTLNDSLQVEIDKAREVHSEKDLNIENLRGQLDTIATKTDDDEKNKTRYMEIEQESQELQQDNQELQQELLEQQRVTDEVRREAAGFLQEMKALSRQSQESYEREEYLFQQVQLLEDEVAQWKDRYARSKAQKRAADIDIAIDQPQLDRSAYLQPNGAIADYHIIEYQIAIDESLRMSRSNPKGLLPHMKSVVLAVKHITEDMEAMSGSSSKTSKLLTKITGSACNYITAVKNFAYSAGVSPVSLVDAAASHLTAAIIEAVHEVKMHPSAGVDNEDFIPEMLNQPGKHYSTAGRSSVSESVYSTNTAAHYPRQAGLNANGTLTSGVYQNTTYGTANHARNASYNNASNGHARNDSLAVVQTSDRLGASSYANGTETPSRNNSAASFTHNDETFTTPPPAATNNDTSSITPREQEDINLLTSFLEDQTSHLSETIQTLVSLLRASTTLATIPTLSKTLATLTNSLNSVLSRTQAVLDGSSSTSPLRPATQASIAALQSAKAKLAAVEEEAARAANRGVTEWKDVVNGLPPIAFEIVREVRVLGSVVGRLGDGDDFS